ncbi:hypothetical protein [Bathymodiolus azoricus thioautotrophic gill symbiont]|uniref:hypothetical protein n=1 Tax=Bathymodiolus azoricus thioautotrophic gill symbiont TaxID=235205 RepID=UPI0019D35C19|nr:hypothetical protein [Bathymodiolus azoricus thioautotrophic gill symbiont]
MSGVAQVLEAQMHPLTVAISRFISGYAFVAVKADGSIKAWGDSSKGGTTPTATD